MSQDGSIDLIQRSAAGRHRSIPQICWRLASTRFLGDCLGSRSQGPPVATADLLFRGFGFLAKVVSRALQVLPKTLDGVQAEDLDQRLPLLGLGLVDEVRKRASAKEERLPPDAWNASGVPLVGEHDLAPERAAGHDLDRGHAVVLAAHVAHGVLTPFVRQQLDLAREVPLERIGDRALSSAVVSVDDDALALAEVHRHLARNAAEGVHDETLDPLTHRQLLEELADRLRSVAVVLLQDLRKTLGRNPAADHPAFRGASEGTPVRSDGASMLLATAGTGQNDPERVG